MDSARFSFFADIPLRKYVALKPVKYRILFYEINTPQIPPPQLQTQGMKIQLLKSMHHDMSANGQERKKSHSQ